MQLITVTLNYWYLLIPLLTAFAGWLVVRIMFSLLFQPGVQKKIATQAGQFAATIFSAESFQQKITDPANFQKVQPLIEAHMDDFLRHRLKEQMPMIGMFIGDKTIQQLRTIFIQEISNLYPAIMQQFAGTLEQDLDIATLITKRIESIDLQTLRKSIYSGMRSEIRRASLLGFVIGLLIGMIQYILLILIS